MIAHAYAKVNLSLKVAGRRGDGYHLLRSLATSVDWYDEIEATVATEDAMVVEGAELDDDDNLLWSALQAGRKASITRSGIEARLIKRIPMQAGLGGGSADAAAGLALAGELFGVSGEQLAALASGLGADVPFCFTGGFALVEGIGDELTALPPLDGFALAVAVPPIHLSTPAVYARWDVSEPSGSPVFGGDLPPRLREWSPLANDLMPAAFALAPELADWHRDLERSWSRSVLMSGSGPALFSFFVDRDEAEGAAATVAGAARAARAVTPVPQGWRVGGGTLASPDWGVV